MLVWVSLVALLCRARSSSRFQLQPESEQVEEILRKRNLAAYSDFIKRVYTRNDGILNIPLGANGGNPATPYDSQLTQLNVDVDSWVRQAEKDFDNIARPGGKNRVSVENEAAKTTFGDIKNDLKSTTRTFEKDMGKETRTFKKNVKNVAKEQQRWYKSSSKEIARALKLWTKYAKKHRKTVEKGLKTVSKNLNKAMKKFEKKADRVREISQTQSEDLTTASESDDELGAEIEKSTAELDRAEEAMFDEYDRTQDGFYGEVEAEVGNFESDGELELKTLEETDLAPLAEGFMETLADEAEHADSNLQGVAEKGRDELKMLSDFLKKQTLDITSSQRDQQRAAAKLAKTVERAENALGSAQQQNMERISSLKELGEEELDKFETRMTPLQGAVANQMEAGRAEQGRLVVKAAQRLFGEVEQSLMKNINLLSARAEEKAEMLKDSLVRTDKDMMPLRTDAVGLHKSFEKVERTEQAAQDLVRSWPQIRGALEDSATADKAAMDDAVASAKSFSQDLSRTSKEFVNRAFADGVAALFQREGELKKRVGDSFQPPKEVLRQIEEKVRNFNREQQKLALSAAARIDESHKSIADQSTSLGKLVHKVTEEMQAANSSLRVTESKLNGLAEALKMQSEEEFSASTQKFTDGVRSTDQQLTAEVEGYQTQAGARIEEDMAKDKEMENAARGLINDVNVSVAGMEGKAQAIEQRAEEERRKMLPEYEDLRERLGTLGDNLTATTQGWDELKADTEQSATKSISEHVKDADGVLREVFERLSPRLAGGFKQFTAQLHDVVDMQKKRDEEMRAAVGKRFDDTTLKLTDVSDKIAALPALLAKGAAKRQALFDDLRLQRANSARDGDLFKQAAGEMLAEMSALKEEIQGQSEQGSKDIANLMDQSFKDMRVMFDNAKMQDAKNVDALKKDRAAMVSEATDMAENARYEKDEIVRQIHAHQEQLNERADSILSDLGEEMRGVKESEQRLVGELHEQHLNAARDKLKVEGSLADTVRDIARESDENDRAVADGQMRIGQILSKVDDGSLSRLVANATILQQMMREALALPETKAAQAAKAVDNRVGPSRAMLAALDSQRRVLAEQIAGLKEHVTHGFDREARELAVEKDRMASTDELMQKGTRDVQKIFSNEFGSLRTDFEATAREMKQNFELGQYQDTDKVKAVKSNLDNATQQIDKVLLGMDLAENNTKNWQDRISGFFASLGPEFALDLEKIKRQASAATESDLGEIGAAEKQFAKIVVERKRIAEAQAEKLKASARAKLKKLRDDDAAAERERAALFEKIEGAMQATSAELDKEGRTLRLQADRAVVKLNEDLARLDSVATRAASLKDASGPEAKKILTDVVGQLRTEFASLRSEVKNIETTEGVASSFLERARAGRRGLDPEISGLERTVAEEDDVLSAEDALLDREVASLLPRAGAAPRR